MKSGQFWKGVILGYFCCVGLDVVLLSCWFQAHLIFKNLNFHTLYESKSVSDLQAYGDYLFLRVHCHWRI